MSDVKAASTKFELESMRKHCRMVSSEKPPTVTGYLKQDDIDEKQRNRKIQGRRRYCRMFLSMT
jgi:hypothetical protein